MRLLLGFFAFLILCNLNAQEKQEIFESFKLQERRTVRYYIPESNEEEKSNEKHPLILVLDAEYLFDQVVAQVKFYHNFSGMPEAIVVGVNQGDGLRFDDTAFEENTGLPDENSKLFFEFLGMELIPFVATEYNAAPFKMIVGYDMSANFENFFLFKEKPLFNAYVSISPVLAPEMETRIPSRIQDIEQPIFYHLVLEGSKNKKSDQIIALDKALKEIKKESFQYAFHKYPDADHTSIASYSLGKAIDQIFKIFKPISPKEYRENILTSDAPAYDYLEEKYAMIETLFGFEKNVELNDIMAIYAASRKKEDFESLKPLSDLCKKEFPKTMLGFFFEGEYYEQMGEPKKALRTFEKAFGMEEIDFLTKDLALEKMDALKADFGF